MKNALKLWFGFSLTVNRRAYIITGGSLLVLKYVVDTLIFYIFGPGRLLNPIQYLNPSLTYRIAQLSPENSGTPILEVDNGLWFFLTAIWSLPFIWIGASMSVRRAIDAGVSKWLGLFFFLPIINFLFILILCCLPSVPPTTKEVLMANQSQQSHLFVHAFKSIGLTVLVGLAMIVLSVFGLGTYGEVLFVGTPFVMGVLSAYWLQQPGARGLTASVVVAVMSVLVCAGALVLLALEGALCLLMAAPIAIILSVLGALLGHAMVELYSLARNSMAAVTVALPVLMVLGVTAPEALPEHSVTTSIEIDASPEEVWPHVVGFSELPPPQDWLLKTGIAVPIRARIEGEGVGAVRYCEFTTGPFIEPITVWDFPDRLAFDVIQQPPSMEEWSPYQVVHAPHIVGGLVSKRGQFRLIRLAAGRTRVEGTTWYTVDMGPQKYWSVWSDFLIHAIHGRVLRHVKNLSESTTS